jgi:CRISPR/Cas system-associated protein Csm6
MLTSTVFYSTSTQHSQYSKLVISMPMMMPATSSASSQLASLQNSARLFWGIVAFLVASRRTEYTGQ